MRSLLCLFIVANLLYIESALCGIFYFKKVVKWCYLQDLVKKEDKKTEVKEIVSEDITDENEKIKKWFLTNTKIIIQRSYRIIFDFKGDWNASKEDKENVICIIEYVYQNAGMDEQTIKEIELF